VGCLKSWVCIGPPAALLQLREGVREEIEAIPPEICRRVFAGVGVRLVECRRRGGLHLDGVVFHR